MDGGEGSGEAEWATKFLSRMFLLFLACTPPTSSMPKPACMKKTKTPHRKMKRELSSS